MKAKSILFILLFGWISQGAFNIALAQEVEVQPAVYYPSGQVVNPNVANTYVVSPSYGYGYNPYVGNPYVTPYYGYGPTVIEYEQNYYPYGPAVCQWINARWEGGRYYPPQKVCDAY